MEISRNINNSVFSYIASILSDNGFNNVSLYDAYPNVEKPDFLSNLPSVSISILNISPEPFEMGNILGVTKRRILIDIFTEETLDGQCSDITDIIFKNIKDKRCDLYNYNLATPTLIGELFFENIEATFSLVSPTLFNQTTIVVDCYTYLIE